MILQWSDVFSLPGGTVQRRLNLLRVAGHQPPRIGQPPARRRNLTVRTTALKITRHDRHRNRPTRPAAHTKANFSSKIRIPPHRCCHVPFADWCGMIL